MLICVLVILGCIVPLAAVSALALAGFRNGDHSGEALARALRADLAAASASGDDRVPPR